MNEQVLITPSESTFKIEDHDDFEVVDVVVDNRLELINVLTKTKVSQEMVQKYLQTPQKESPVLVMNNWLRAYEGNMKMMQIPEFPGQESIHLAQEGAVVRLGVLFEYLKAGIEFGEKTPPFQVDEDQKQSLVDYGEIYNSLFSKLDELITNFHLEDNMADLQNEGWVDGLLTELNTDEQIFGYLVGELCRRKVAPFMEESQGDVVDVTEADGEDIGLSDLGVEI